ncbi:MAG: rhomboid family intramembrane serine protease [Solirubrobacterales bacterium]|nr:rhomboid family intramembrane serine protease [Solirubrobacterales bacterium]MBV9165327.1 rhomboid family intramembrane serine protease [Solirubrobacterales bacterium]MBV9536370.1 rhomboid family intramembrane serine protease [Solirubrobacterales bacterium]
MSVDRTGVSTPTKHKVASSAATSPPHKGPIGALERRRQRSVEGLKLLAVIVTAMWIVEVINALHSNKLDTTGGIYPRNIEHLWAIFTSPFLHAGFGHLIANTIPFVFMGAIIALQGAARLALVTAIVIIIGGLGTWLISPGGTDTVGASGMVFGYAAYLLARGLFDRSVVELLVGGIVGLLWGWALIASLVPHGNVSWQGHLTGALGGIIAAWLLAGWDRRGRRELPVGLGSRSRRLSPAARGPSAGPSDK